MEKLSMCRICLSEDIRLRSIVKTHLQEMYESLTKMPFLTEDSRPVLACDLCCAKLENSHELKRKCLQSEKLFTQLLRSHVISLQLPGQPSGMSCWILSRIPPWAAKTASLPQEAEVQGGHILEYGAPLATPVLYEAPTDPEISAAITTSLPQESDVQGAHILGYGATLATPVLYEAPTEPEISEAQTISWPLEAETQGGISLASEYEELQPPTVLYQVQTDPEASEAQTTSWLQEAEAQGGASPTSEYEELQAPTVLYQVQTEPGASEAHTISWLQEAEAQVGASPTSEYEELQAPTVLYQVQTEPGASEAQTTCWLQEAEAQGGASPTSEYEELQAPTVLYQTQTDPEASADARDDSSASAGAEDDTGTCSIVRTEPAVDNVMPNFEEDGLEGDDDSIQYSDSGDIISLAVIKNEQSDVTANARDDSSASAGAEDDTGTCSMVRTEPAVDNVVPNFEEDRLEGDDDSIQYSDSGDIISLAVIENEQSDVTANARDDSSAYSGAEDDTGTCSIIRTEPAEDNVMPNFEEDRLEGDDDSIQYSDSGDIISLAVIENEQSVVTANARDESSASAGAEDDTGTCSMIRTEPAVDNVMPNFEEDRLEGDDDSIQYSDSGDIISLAVIKNEQSDVTAKARDDSGSGEDTYTRDAVRAEVDDLMAGAPVPKKLRVDAQKNREDKSSKNLKRSDQSKDKIAERKSDTKKAVQDKPVRRSKRVGTCAKLDIKLHNNKHNSTSDHNDVHKEICANNIRAHPSVNSSSSNKLKQFVCDTCQKCFRIKSLLINHIVTHTGEKRYQCKVCNKCFFHQTNLKRHIHMHAGEKPYQCNVCKKCFTQNNNLIRHMRIHTGEKPYQCNVCQKGFSQKINLDTHIRTHTGEKPYQCNVCKKRFSDKPGMNVHIRTHTNEKPYQCDVCKKCFSHKIYLFRHIRVHAGDKPYQCNVCGKSFSRKSILTTHTRTHNKKSLSV